MEKYPNIEMLVSKTTSSVIAAARLTAEAIQANEINGSWHQCLGGQVLPELLRKQEKLEKSKWFALTIHLTLLKQLKANHQAAVVQKREPSKFGDSEFFKNTITPAHQSCRNIKARGFHGAEIDYDRCFGILR